MAFPSPDLKTVLKGWVRARKPAGLNELYQFCREGLSNIQPESCQKIVDGYHKHLLEVHVCIYCVCIYSSLYPFGHL